MDEERQQLLGIAKELYGRLIYSHKTHEKQREICSEGVVRTKWAAIILTGLTFFTASAAAFVPIDLQNILVVITALLCAVSFAYSFFQLSFTPEKLVQEHRFTAKKLLSARDRMVFIIGELMDQSCYTENTKKKLEAINAEITLIYEYAPDTSEKAYKKAWPALNENEEMTFSEAEIDLLLPAQLRTKK